MNYKDKTNKNIDIDDMDIKSHLNASLDLSGISVSEDLIHRTLEAVHKQTAERTDLTGANHTPDVRVIPWNRYIRAFAGVAAAAIIVVAGYGLINGAVNNKSDSLNDNSIYRTDAANSPLANSSEYAAADQATDNTDNSLAAGSGVLPDSAEADGSTSDTATGDKSIAAEDFAQKFTISFDADMADNSEGTNGSAGIASVDGASSDDQSAKEESTQVLTFREIFLPDPAQAQSLTITDGNNASVTLTSQDEIIDFYSIMDKYQFSYSTNAGAEKNYTVTITAPQQNEAVYTMTVGKDIIVSFTGHDTSGQSSYSVTDSTSLLKDLQEFFDKYHK